MRIVSWNVNSIRARLERALSYVDRTAPDVLCLQETKVVDDEFPREEFESRGYEVALFGQRTYNGVALISKAPLEDVHRGLTGEEDEQARLIGARVGGLTLFNAYVPNGQEVGAEAYDYKLDWLARLHDLLAARIESGEDVVICGDWNVALEDRDVHAPKLWEGKILCSDKERAAIRRLMALGMEDVFRRFHEDDGLFSWWDYRRLGFPKNKGLRIDYFLAAGAAAARCEDVVINREERKGSKPSDHAPVEATFRSS